MSSRSDHQIYTAAHIGERRASVRMGMERLQLCYEAGRTEIQRQPEGSVQVCNLLKKFKAMFSDDEAKIQWSLFGARRGSHLLRVVLAYCQNGGRLAKPGDFQLLLLHAFLLFQIDHHAPRYLQKELQKPNPVVAVARQLTDQLPRLVDAVHAAMLSPTMTCRKSTIEELQLLALNTVILLFVSMSATPMSEWEEVRSSPEFVAPLRRALALNKRDTPFQLPKAFDYTINNILHAANPRSGPGSYTLITEAKTRAALWEQCALEGCTRSIGRGDQMFRCGRCRTRLYCGKDHQSQDYLSRHWLDCYRDNKATLP